MRTPSIPRQLNLRVVFTLIMAALLAACAAPGSSEKDRRDHVQRMRQDVLAELYQLRPEAQAEINSAPGYAVFSNRNVQFIFGGGGGYGVVVDNATGASTYMRMAEGSIGLRVGVKNFRAVYVFSEKHIMDEFIDRGWQLVGSADAALKSADSGAAGGGEKLLDGIKAYELTEAGVAVGITARIPRYYKDPDLN